LNRHPPGKYPVKMGVCANKSGHEKLAISIDLLIVRVLMEQYFFFCQSFYTLFVNAYSKPIQYFIWPGPGDNAAVINDHAFLALSELL